MDTGSGHDIVAESELSRAELSKAFDLGNGMSFTTANGLVDAAQQVKMQIPHMPEETNPFVMPESPALLSVGRRCMLEGYSFIWKAGEAPFLVRPDGMIVDLQVEGLIPYISKSCSTRLPRNKDNLIFKGYAGVVQEAASSQVVSTTLADEEPPITVVSTTGDKRALEPPFPSGTVLAPVTLPPVPPGPEEERVEG